MGLRGYAPRKVVAFDGHRSGPPPRWRHVTYSGLGILAPGLHRSGVSIHLKDTSRADC